MNTKFATQERLGNGVECVVYDIGDNLVLKCFHHENNARFAFEMQKIGHNAQIAPEPIGLNGCEYYSEKLEVLEDYLYKNNISFRCDFMESEQYQDLMYEVDNCYGAGFFDGHEGNIGFLPNGELCLIDFGYVGFSDNEMANELMAKIEH